MEKWISQAVVRLLLRLSRMRGEVVLSWARVGHMVVVDGPLK